MKNENLDYLKYLSTVEPEIIDLKVPSGFVFKFKQPNSMGLLLNGYMPEMFVSDVLEAWKQQGVSMPKSEEKTGNELTKEQTAVAERMTKAVDMLLDLSVQPKIVFNEPDRKKGEIIFSDIPDKDLTFLLRWVLSGGSLAFMAATFPQG